MIRQGTGLSLYVCPACGVRELRAGRFVPMPEETRCYKGEEVRLPEICACLAEMVWTPESSAHDLLGENFIVEIDGQSHKFSSLSEVRSFEAASRRRFANGEGAPLNFRVFSQDHSNRDRNSLQGSHLELARAKPIPRRTASGQLIRAGALRPQDVER